MCYYHTLYLETFLIVTKCKSGSQWISDFGIDILNNDLARRSQGLDVSMQNWVDFRENVHESICSDPFAASECLLFITVFPLMYE